VFWVWVAIGCNIFVFPFGIFGIEPFDLGFFILFILWLGMFKSWVI